MKICAELVSVDVSGVAIFFQRERSSARRVSGGERVVVVLSGSKHWCDEVLSYLPT